MNKKKLRILEFLVILLVIIVGGFLVLNAVASAWGRAREAKNREICALHLKHWASVLAMYADESKEGLYPPIQATPTISFELDLNNLYPQYVSDLSSVACPSDIKPPPPSLDLKPLSPDARRRVLAGLSHSYSYLGWAFDRLEDVPEQCLPLDKLPPALAAAWNRLGGNLKPPIEPWKERGVCRQMALTAEQVLQSGDSAKADVRLDVSDGNRGAGIVHRLRKGVERILAADAGTTPEEPARIAAGIPVMLDTFLNTPTAVMFMHLPGGSNVLFLDGHVAFCKYPGPGPVNRSVGSFLEMLDMIKWCTP